MVRICDHRAAVTARCCYRATVRNMNCRMFDVRIDPADDSPSGFTCTAESHDGQVQARGPRLSDVVPIMALSGGALLELCKAVAEWQEGSC